MEQVRKKGSRGTGTNSNGAEGGVRKVTKFSQKIRVAIKVRFYHKKSTRNS